MAYQTKQQLLQQGLTIHDLSAAEAFAEGECDRVKPFNREAYRATVLRRVYSDLLDSLLDDRVFVTDGQNTFGTDHDRRRLLAKLEAEQAFHLAVQ